MKKLVLAIAAMALLAIGTTSCNKEKVCKCTATVGGISVEVGEYTIQEGNCTDLETTIAGYNVVHCTRK